MEHLKEELENRFEKGMNITIGQKIIEENLWHHAFSLVHDTNPQIAFRAAWALQWAMQHSGKPLTEFSEHILTVFLSSDNGSVLRIYARAIFLIIPRIELSDSLAGQIAEKSFPLLLDSSTKVAVKVWLMEILSFLSDRIDYVAENLTDCIRMLSEADDCSAAMTSHCRKLLKKQKPRY